MCTALAISPALFAAQASTDAATKQSSSSSRAEPAELPPPPLPVALYLTWQRDPTTTMTVHWQTDWTEGFVDTVLEYRAAGGPMNAPWSRAEGHAAPFPFSNRMVHTVEIAKLQPDTLYQFRFGRLATRESDGAMQFQPHGAVQKFRTLPAQLSRPVKFVAGGDIYGGSYVELSANMCKAAAARDPEFAVMGGDIAYANDEPKAAPRWFEFFRIWRETMVTKDGRLIPIVPTIGNHEAHGDTYLVRGGTPARGMAVNRAAVYYSVFAFPGRVGYNVLDAGDYLTLVALDSSHTVPVAGAQTDWLRDTLARRRSVPWIVPFYHVPAYPSNRPFTGAVSAAVREHWVPLFDEARVRFAFEHHDHTYKVSHPMRGGQRDPAGTRYLGDGAWSVTPRVTTPLEKAPYLERAMSKNHVFVVTLHPERAEIAAIDPTGAEFDTFEIRARP